MLAGRRSRCRTLAVAIRTRDGATRLPGLLAQAQSFADEIVVAVDDATVDDSFELARAGADLVLRFRHGGLFDAAENALIARTRCDWLLRIDDDERVDAALPGLLDDLLDDRYTHWHVLSVVVTSVEPPLAIYQPPWHPHWVPRLVRADASLVWRNPAPHAPLLAMGLGGWESRTAILHLEPVLFDAAGIAAKIERYRRLGRGEWWRYNAEDWRTLGEPLRVPILEAGSRRTTRARVDDRIIDVDVLPRLPPWGAKIEVSMPSRARPGERLLAEAVLHNTGAMTWWPTATPDEHWPQLGLHHVITSADGTVHQGGGNPVPRIVAPGERAQLLCVVTAPPLAGDYVLEWDMASHDECWFSQLGSARARTCLAVA